MSVVLGTQSQAASMTVSQLATSVGLINYVRITIFVKVPVQSNKPSRGRQMLLYRAACPQSIVSTGFQHQHLTPVRNGFRTCAWQTAWLPQPACLASSVLLLFVVPCHHPTLVFLQLASCLQPAELSTPQASLAFPFCLDTPTPESTYSLIFALCTVVAQHFALYRTELSVSVQG